MVVDVETMPDTGCTLQWHNAKHVRQTRMKTVELAHEAAKAAASGTFGLGRGMEEVDLSDSLAEPGAQSLKMSKG